MRLVLATVVLLSVICAPLYAQAQRSIRIETRDAATPNGKPAAELVVNGQTVMRLAKEQRQKSPLRNISVAAALIAEAYRRGTPELKLQPADEGGLRIALYLNGKLLVLATDTEAKAWGVTVDQLAATWRKNLTSALGVQAGAVTTVQPVGVATEAREPATPANGSRPPQGNGAKPPAAGHTPPASKPQPPEPAPRTSGGLLTVSGGHNVYEPPSQTSLERSVTPDALTAQVTGTRVSSSDAARCVEQVLRNYAKLPPEQKLSWKVTLPEDGSLAVAAGQQKQLTIEYSIAGRGDPTRPSAVNVALKNIALATPKESLTLFSNKPEGVKKTQLLYYAQLPPRQAARLVLHHQNQSHGGMQMIARVVNPGSQAAAVHVIPGGCEPDINTFFVGFKSAEVFWNNLNSGSGMVLPVPAGGQAYIVSQLLPAGYTSSGYFKLTNLSEQPLRIETLTLPPGAAAQSAPYQDSPDASQGVFPAPYITVTESYETGDDWLYLRLGQDSHDSLVDGSRFDGSYGITYSFNVEVHNAKAEPALVFVVLRASAGEVKGQFFIDDEYIATPLVASGDEVLLKELPLRPGQTKLLKIKGLPLNGGFYPASIILRESRLP